MSRRCLQSLFSFILLSFWFTSSLQTVAQAEPIQADHTTVELVADAASLTPGVDFNVAITFEMEPHWHVYWQNPGSSGLPVEISWDLPEGIKAGEIVWPTPEFIETGGLVTYGYENVVTFVVPFSISNEISTSATALIKADLFWLICKEVCLPGDASLELSLPISDHPGDPVNSQRFQAARASWPAATTPWEAIASTDSKTVFIEIKSELPDSIPPELYFYASKEGVIDPNAAQTLSFSSPQIATLRAPLAETFDREETPKIEGVFQAEDSSWSASIKWNDHKAMGIDGKGTLTKPPAVGLISPKQETSTQSNQGFEAQLLEMGLPGWLLLAFLGGAILNVMPCVLPVLSLKVFSLLKHTGESKRQSLLHGLAYTAGVVVSFLALAGVLFILRSIGERVGWGFQLQNPAFIVLLFVLFFLFALNLFGVFEIGTSLVGSDAKVSQRADLGGSFGMGILAAVVGAPCIGPLLASVSGIAVQASIGIGLAIFGMMGFGLAAPFLILAIFPNLVRFLPKPGAWMEAFKQLMGFLLLAAAIFLCTVAGLSGGVDAMVTLMITALSVAFAAWIYGRWSAPVKPKSTRRIAQLISVTILGLALYSGVTKVDHSYNTSPNASEASEGVESEWRTWSQANVEQALAANKPVFVDFTASWCLICQVNKKVALRTEETQNLFEQHGIATFEADWTRYDAKITEALEQFGRSGVPLYLFYLPDGTVEVLPQSLTNTVIKDVIESSLNQ